MINHRDYYNEIHKCFNELEDRYASYSERRTLHNRNTLLSTINEFQYNIRSFKTAVKNEFINKGG